MKRLLLFTGWYPIPENPFQYTFVSQQIKIMQYFLPSLSKNRWEIAVWHQGTPVDLPNYFLRNRKTRSYTWNDDGIKIFYDQSYIIAHRLQYPQYQLQILQMRSTFNEIKEHLGGVPDIVWTVTLSSAILWNRFSINQRLKVPFFLQEHSVPLTMHLNKKYKISEARDLSKAMKEVVIVAERQIMEFQNLSENYNCRVIWNPVDPVFYQVSGKNHKKGTLLFVGRLSHQKGLDILIKAMAQVKKINSSLKLYIVGNGEQEDELKLLAETLGVQDQIIFLGTKSSGEISEIMDTMEVFVLPSRYENCPVSLLEGQVKGMPCLVTRNGASEKVLLPGNGLSVMEDGTGKHIASGILKIFETINQYNRTDIRKRSLEKFSTKIFAEKMYSVFNDII